MSAKFYWNQSSGFWQEDFFSSFLYRYIGKISPTPSSHVFWQIMTAWTILVKGHQGNISAKLYWNRSSGFWQEDFFSSFLYRYIGKISPTPLAAIFFDESWWLEQPWKRVTKDTFLPSYIEIGPSVSDKKIFKVFYIDTYIGKISPAPWRPCFLTNPNGLNNLGKGSPKQHFCKIIWKSVQWFGTRWFLHFSIHRENKPRPLAAMFFDESKWLEQSW